MKKNTKIRGLVWLLLAIAGILAVGMTSYTQQQTNLAGDKIFQDKTEDQVGIEFLEIYSSKFEALPIISETREDYSFDVYRSILSEDTLSSNLYITVNNLTDSDDEESDLPLIGLIDFMVYCSTDENTYEKLVDFKRLGTIAGTNVYANFLEMKHDVIDDCATNQFTLVMDSSRAEEVYGLDILEEINLSDIYDVQAVSTGALLDQDVELSNGFEGDLTKSSYNIYSWQKAFINGGLSILVILPIAFGLFYVTEKELFENNILDRKKK